MKWLLFTCFNLLPLKVLASGIATIMLDLICSHQIRLGYKDMTSLSLACNSYHVRITWSVFNLVQLAESTLAKNLVLNRFINHQMLFSSHSSIKDELKGKTLLDLIWLSLLKKDGLDENMIREIVIRMADPPAFGKLSRLLAECSDMHNLLNSFVKPITYILAPFRRFGLRSTVAEMTDMLGIVKATLDQVVLAPNNLMINALGVLFNAEAERIVRSNGKQEIYEELKKIFNPPNDNQHIWNAIMDAEMAINVWKLQRLSYRIRRMMTSAAAERDEATEASEEQTPAMSICLKQSR